MIGALVDIAYHPWVYRTSTRATSPSTLPGSAEQGKRVATRIHKEPAAMSEHNQATSRCLLLFFVDGGGWEKKTRVAIDSRYL